MKKIILVIFVSLFSFNYAQDNNISEFITNNSVVQKIENVIKFVQTSSTIKANYYNDEPLFVIVDFKVSNIIIDKEIPANTAYQGMLSVFIDNGNVWGDVSGDKNCYLYKVNESIYLMLYVRERDKKYILNEKYFSSTCKQLKRTQSKIVMPQSIFDYTIDQNEIAYLIGLSTYDALEFLKIEFIDK
ncbi:hypothetical protein [Soonwooa sp.]|uniref:hypothetical protein n=1 Tax=Soonwooa sp. TaxID=1938592 RepID=UPI002638E58F|nr:hypothetical protein [Soonwooa sp.]